MSTKEDWWKKIGMIVVIGIFFLIILMYWLQIGEEKTTVEEVREETEKSRDEDVTKKDDTVEIPRFVPSFLTYRPDGQLLKEKENGKITSIHWRDWNRPRFYNPYDSCSPTAIYDYSRGRYVIVQPWWCSDRYYMDRYYHYPWIPEHHYRRWNMPRYPYHHHPH